MVFDYKFTFPLPAGLHARPAGALADIAAAFKAEVCLLNERTGTSVNAKSMLSMIGAEVRKGDICRLRAAGADGAAAHAALREFIDLVLPLSDAPLPGTDTRRGSAKLPRGLEQEVSSFIPGTVIHPGLGQGRIVFLRGRSLPETFNQTVVAAPPQEEVVLLKAVSGFRKRIEQQQAGHTASAAAILKAHLSILNDCVFLDRLLNSVRNGRSSGQAVVETGRYFTGMLSAVGSDYIQERAADIQEVCLDLLQDLYGQEFGSPQECLTELSIVIADHPGPRELLELDRKFLRGLVFRELGQTSHAAILARAFDIPALSGIGAGGLRAGQPAVIDARQGVLIAEPNERVIRYYQKEAAVLNRRHEKEVVNARAPAITADGLRLEVAANISTAEEVCPAVALGAEGIGLFRTEMLYLSRDSAPAEEVQVRAYRTALLHAAGRPVIIRTFDIGGDKPAAYLDLIKEENPFLGYRGVRIYQEHLDIFETQLRAIIRASADGTIRLMIPMISSVEEIRWVKDRITALQAELERSGVSFNPKMALGVMIETPSAAFSIETLSGEVDFFSIGTNDLSQYFFAADRTNGRVSGLCCVRHPAFLRLLSHAVTQARACGKWIGLCGEMAGDPAALPLLLGLGLNEISVSSARIPRIKQLLATLSSEVCRRTLEKALRCSTSVEVDTLLSQLDPAAEQCLLEPDLILLDSDSETKEEAIRELVNALYVSGRTDDPGAIEDAVWSRETVGVTGVGFGFGIPHCKSDAMKHSSIGIVRLQRPVSWCPKEETSVRMIIMLAMRQSDSDTLHMRIFSKLARRLMHEEFRRPLLEAATATDAGLFLEQELNMKLVRNEGAK